MLLKLKNILDAVSFIIVAVAVIVGLLWSFRGDIDIRYFGKTLDTRIGGPFETSGSNSRYALTKSIVEDKSLFLSENLARFSSPDVVYYNNHYISIFTPGVSFAAVPLYLIGKNLGLEQVFTYALNPIFLLISFFLIVKLVEKISGNIKAGYLAGLAYVFGTNALNYSSTLTQHTITSALLLLVTYLAFYRKGVVAAFLVGFLYGFGVTVDIPNSLILLPALVVAISRATVVNPKKEKIDIKMDITTTILVFVGMLLPLYFFGIYNQKTLGSPYKLAQMVGRNTGLKEEVATYTPKTEEKKIIHEDTAAKTSLPFNPRKQIQGLSVLLIGEERGYLFYYPVLILSILGIITLIKSSDKRFAIYGITSISLIISMYSMFGDPWGGWAFGARYLIPANALLSVFLGVAIAKFAKNILFSLAFISLSAISIYVNTIGTLTTSAIPPKGEAKALPNPTPYTIEYNKKLIAQNQSSSLVYNSIFRQKISLDGFSKHLSISILAILIFIYLSNLVENRPKRQQI